MNYFNPRKLDKTEFVKVGNNIKNPETIRHW